MLNCVEERMSVTLPTSVLKRAATLGKKKGSDSKKVRWRE